jgi:hypothetical protein
MLSAEQRTVLHVSRQVWRDLQLSNGVSVCWVTDISSPEEARFVSECGSLLVRMNFGAARSWSVKLGIFMRFSASCVPLIRQGWVLLGEFFSCGVSVGFFPFVCFV